MKHGLRWLWPVLLIGSIIYAAGPNGAWMSRQFVDPVPPAWGWFGALLLGLAVFGGIKFATAGRRIGIAIAGVGGVLAVVVDSQYFASAGHAGVMAFLLGVFPTLLAVLAGIVEGIEATTKETAAEQTARAEQARAAEEARLRLEWELREAAKDREIERRLKQRAASHATQPNAAATQPGAGGDPATQAAVAPAAAKSYRCDRCNRNSMDRFEYAAHRRYCRLRAPSDKLASPPTEERTAQS